MVDINVVYQTVLALADKDQGGYITPQEFNLFAEHAQMEIFEQSLYDLTPFNRVPGNKTDYSDAVGIIEDKIHFFIAKVDDISSGSYVLPTAAGASEEFYRMNSVTMYDSAGNGYPAEKTDRHQQNIYKAPLLQPTLKRPIYYMLGVNSGMSVQFRPDDVPNTTVNTSWIRKPKKPNWTYIVSANTNKPLWNANAVDVQHFELHPSEKEVLVNKILHAAGVSVGDYNLAQVATAEEVKTIQQEKA